MFPKSRAPRAVFAAACAALLLAACGSEQAPADTSDAAATPAAAGEVNLYTTREPGLIQPLLDAFTAQSGIEVNTVFLKDGLRSEEHTSELQSLMRISYAVFCLKKKNTYTSHQTFS